MVFLLLITLKIEKMNINKIVLELAESLTDIGRSLETIANSERILKQAYEGTANPV